MAARRAKAFALTANQGNLTREVMEQIHDDVRQLATDYPQRPLSELLGDLVQTQETLYTLLENRQRPEQARQLYFLTGVTSGLLAKASHDLADPHAALTQARTAYLCAENADHNGLRAWIRGLQSLISYWAGRLHESVKYAQAGAQFATLGHSTTAVWLPVSEARAWAALGNADQTHSAIRRAEDAWETVRPDEVDELGGMCTFGRSRQIYYAADALAWLPSEAGAAQGYAARAVEAYADTSDPEWSFGDEAGSRTDLAIARINLGELEGADEAVSPILELAPENRINGIVNSAMRVHNALSQSSLSVPGSELQERIEMFTRTPLKSLPR
ncbi:transcriptional regulator [Streptomyces agglomeratus]|uniref:Transcriptional regulator n=1 Tax=Streptomyces agglomeratus TaxID=285458 RepID=A0A1E5PJB8_9ACTN|nr:transcriptional regulator [Streptomyces agglomeratus]